MNESTIWNFLFSQGLPTNAVFGLMGNLRAESGLNPINMENQYEKKLNFTDQTYTAAVDNGTYQNFAIDRCGYGLAQWTSGGRKQGLLDYARKTNRSIGNITMQLEYLMIELNSNYRGVLNGIKAAKSIREASDIVLLKFEIPADRSESVKQSRAALGEDIYMQYVVSIGANNNSPYAIPTKNIRYNSRGNGVRYVQYALNKIGGYHLIVDGIFGNLSVAALKDFQQKNGLVPDGIAGKLTIAKIRELL